MLEELRRMAADKDPERITLPDFINHDIRRTVRTPALRLGEEVREAILAHECPGIKRSTTSTNISNKSAKRSRFGMHGCGL
jgi:hypothetical protein